MAGHLPPLGAAVDVTYPPTYSVWRAVVVRHVSDAHVEVRFHHWDGELDETEDDMVVPATVATELVIIYLGRLGIRLAPAFQTARLAPLPRGYHPRTRYRHRIQGPIHTGASRRP
jgi:hypothetical protein